MVLDLGCGTGILSVFSACLGDAKKVLIKSIARVLGQPVEHAKYRPEPNLLIISLLFMFGKKTVIKIASPDNHFSLFSLSD